VAALEQDVLRAQRAQSTPDALVSRLARWPRRLRAAAVLAIGLVLGVGAQMASAQVQDARVRADYEKALQAEREVLMMRQRIVAELAEKATKEFEVGMIDRTAMLRAELERKLVELSVAKLALQMEEIQLTSKAARDELWAPKVNGRDFVAERLKVEAVAAQQRLQHAERLAQEVEEAKTLGPVLVGKIVEVERERREARQEFEMRAMRVKLREEALEQSMSPEQVTRRAQRIDYMLALKQAQERVRSAQVRRQYVQERVKLGLMTRIEELRADLEVLESEEALQRAQKEIARLERPEEEGQ
jgi:hypothetical protein